MGVIPPAAPVARDVALADALLYCADPDGDCTAAADGLVDDVFDVGDVDVVGEVVLDGEGDADVDEGGASTEGDVCAPFVSSLPHAAVEMVMSAAPKAAMRRFIVTCVMLRS